MKRVIYGEHAENLIDWHTTGYVCPTVDNYSGCPLKNESNRIGTGALSFSIFLEYVDFF